MGGGEPVKVVIIKTEYVETDAMNFKSVVQKLTGKESTVAPAATKQRRTGFSRESVLDRVMSFKDLDRMLMELPALDELYRLFPE